jgi:DNA-3-methyladenine glycosylase II
MIQPGKRPEHGPSAATFVLRPHAPFRLDLTVWALRRRSRNRIDAWDGTYRRALVVGGRALTVQVATNGDLSAPVLTVSVLTPGPFPPDVVASVQSQVVRLLGTNVDLTKFYDFAEADPPVGPLISRLVGLHPPRFPTLFEAIANAIANQQLSLEVGIELLNRFAERFGARPVGEHGLVAFPEPETVLEAQAADLRDLGFSTRKSDYLRDSAHAIVTGAIDTERLVSSDRTTATQLLLTLRGIGRWSAEYVLLRGLGRLDVFPADDVGARNKLQRLMNLARAPSRDQIVETMERWNPYAGMIYFHLLLDGLAERGELHV